MKQLEIICVDDMVVADHRYRRFMKIWDFKAVDAALSAVKNHSSYEGYGIQKLFRCLLLQFLEDLSDRELETFLVENIAGKWFCGFSLHEKTPDHTVFTRARKRIGTALLGKLFEQLKDQLRAGGFIHEVFTFVDASHLISKATLWEERDEALKKV